MSTTQQIKGRSPLSVGQEEPAVASFQPSSDKRGRQLHRQLQPSLVRLLSGGRVLAQLGEPGLQPYGLERRPSRRLPRPVVQLAHLILRSVEATQSQERLGMQRQPGRGTQAVDPLAYGGIVEL